MKTPEPKTCPVCKGRTWINIQPRELQVYRVRWFGTRLVPGLNDCPACRHEEPQPSGARWTTVGD